MLALGEDVAVLVPREAGRDEMGEPVCEWDATVVGGCLVRPLTGQDAPDPTGPDLRRAEYRVAFPKSYSGPVGEELSLCRVALVARGMDPADPGSAYLVTASSDHVRPCPTMWDMTADIGRAHG